jgi:hypothetical protein
MQAGAGRGFSQMPGRSHDIGAEQARSPAMYPVLSTKNWIYYRTGGQFVRYGVFAGKPGIENRPAIPGESPPVASEEH